MATQTGATLDGDYMVSAGARSLIKRAARAFGEDATSQWNGDDCAYWARLHPDLVAASVARSFEAAAKAWERGNNSGNQAGLDAEERDCDNQRAFAEIVLRVFGVTCTYPGLYPVFRSGSGDSVREWYGHDPVTITKAMRHGARIVGEQSTNLPWPCSVCGSKALAGLGAVDRYGSSIAGKCASCGWLNGTKRPTGAA